MNSEIDVFGTEIYYSYLFSGWGGGEVHK